MNATANCLNTAADNEIVQAVSVLSAATFPDNLRSIVLTGSLARGEGTWLHEGTRIRLAGDAEFLLIFKDRMPLPPTSSAKRLRAAVEARLAGHGIDANIDLSPVGADYLRAIRPHIFAYELIECGQAVWGDEHVLGLVPSFNAADIPLEDGYRMLLNRMTELLEVLCALEDDGRITDAVRYRTVKLWLDMATSYLLFMGQYKPTYRGRAARLRELLARSAPCPLRLGRFAERVEIATQRKLGQLNDFGIHSQTELFQLIDDLRLLWRWELQRLTGMPPGTADRDLMHRWVVSQRLPERVRGWALVARHCGLVAGLAHLTRWGRRALTGSPRRLLYAAVSELMFAMPAILLAPGHGMASAPRWDELRLNLPITRPSDSILSACAWRRLGLAVTWNYHQFLEFTRS